MAEREEIVWHVLTHEHKEHSADWYWGLALLTIAGAGVSVYFGNLLLAIILVVGAGSIATLKVRGPREHEVRMDARGVTLDGTLYLWKSVQSFWVNTGAEHSEPSLFLTTKSFVLPRINVPLDSIEHAGDVRAFATRFAHEEEQQPHFTEHLAQIFGL